jgi:methionyl-tRNA formyltransferase
VEAIRGISVNMKTRVLFFGREGCQYTEQALSYLRLLDYDVEAIINKGRGEKLPEDIHWWDGDLIICFRTYFILPEILIKKARVAAINFHPGPPKHPGTGCINFALYEDDTEYGTTAHLMDKSIDSGKILRVRMFPIAQSDNVSSLLKRTHHEMLSLFYDVVDTIRSAEVADMETVFGPEISTKRWRRKARRLVDLENIQTSDVDITKDELEKKIRATHTVDFPTSISFHGYRFGLKL